jgi:hypothetical protein
MPVVATRDGKNTTNDLVWICMHQMHQVVVMSMHFPVSAPMGFLSGFVSLLLAVTSAAPPKQHHLCTHLNKGQTQAWTNPHTVSAASAALSVQLRRMQLLFTAGSGSKPLADCSEPLPSSSKHLPGSSRPLADSSTCCCSDPKYMNLSTGAMEHPTTASTHAAARRRWATVNASGTHSNN